MCSKVCKTVAMCPATKCEFAHEGCIGDMHQRIEAAFDCECGLDNCVNA